MLAEPAPDVEILDFNPMGAQLAVRPYCHTDHFWQVWFDTNRVIREEFSRAGYAVPAAMKLANEPASVMPSSRIWPFADSA